MKSRIIQDSKWKAEFHDLLHPLKWFLHVTNHLTYRSKPMFRPTSCLVLRGCTRVWNCCLRCASCAASKHKAHTSPCPHELGQTRAADSRLADPRMAISGNILAHPRNPVRHPGDSLVAPLFILVTREDFVYSRNFLVWRLLEAFFHIFKKNSVLQLPFPRDCWSLTLTLGPWLYRMISPP